MNEQTSTSLLGKAPPGPGGIPFFGSLLSIRNDPHLAIDRIARQYGDVCLLRFGSVPTVVISHPGLLREAFDKAELSDRWVSEMTGILTHHGADLAMAPYGEHWRQMQRFANRELLSRRNLQQIRERYVEEVVNRLVDEVGEKSDAGQPVEPIEMLSRSNSMIMFRAIFGASASDSSQFQDKLDELLQFIFWTFKTGTATNPADYLPWLKFLPNNVLKEAERRAEARDAILDFLIDGVRARPDFDPENPTCLVDVMLSREQAGEITMEVVRMLISDLLLAGIDTSAQTVTWLLLVLANRPEVQSKVHEELDRVVGPGNTPSMEDRERLPGLHAVILENMRYRTVGPLGLPHRAAKACEVGGFTIPEGAQVLGNIYSIHHDPRFWDSPHEFLADRFLPLADGSPSPAMTGGAFMPFGVGRRSCPGWQFGEIVVWTHASRLLNRYRFEPADLTGGPATGGPATGGPEGRLSEDEVFGLTVGPKPYALRAVRR